MGPVRELEALARLAEEVAACQACGLAATRRHVVPGEGVAPSDLMLVGEGPGAREDELGRPFVGRSGQLLDRLLAEELGRDRTRCYIANTVKCRPPGNRTPAPEELAACRGFLERQVELVDPRLIVALGATAAGWFLGPGARIGELRGRVLEWQGRGLIVTYHPSAALRGGAKIVAALRSDLARAGVWLGERGRP